MKSPFVLGMLFVLGCSAARKSYRGYQVLQAFGDDFQDLQFLKDEADANKVGIIGSGPSDLAMATTTFYVAPQLVDEIKENLHTRRIAFRITSTDLQRDIDFKAAENSKARIGGEWFLSYHTFDEILVWLDEQVALCGSQCSLVDIGSSYEGRPLRAIKITGAANACVQKPAIWIDAGNTARDWLVPTTAMYIINGLITEYATDPIIQNFRDTYDWYILPVVNPDGYDYTWTTDRMWTKSRQPNPGSTCNGTDINRNFDFQWSSGGGASPCSETYPGPTANSEPETRAVCDFLQSLDGGWDLFWTLHSSGQMYLPPWSFSNIPPSNYLALERIGLAAVQAIFDTHGKRYLYGSEGVIVYTISGSPFDWATGIPFIPFAYTLELRGTGSSILPPLEIIPTGEEIWAGLNSTVQSVQVEKPPTCVSV